MSAGPGIQMLASLSGHDPSALVADPGLALRSLAQVAREMARLGADRASPDAEVRAAAERRTAEIAALVAELDSATPEPSPSAATRRFQSRLETILRNALHDLESRA